MHMFVDLCTSVWALSALRVAAESDLFGALSRGERDAAALALACGLDAEATRRILAVLAAHDFVRADGDRFALTEEGAQLAARGRGLLADFAATFGQTRALVEEARRSTLRSGWRHVDPDVIRAQAGLSFEMTARMIGPMTATWPEIGRLFARENARMLDVGVGAAGGAIAMCRQFPNLRVVGIDPHRAAHLEARSAVETAGLAHRIELRLGRVEDLIDEHVFDVAFIAAKFFDVAALATGLERIRRALVPGGALFLGAWRDPGDPRRAAVSRLREHLWGGEALPAADVVRMLESAGFVDVREGPGRGDLAPLAAFAPATTP
jgi:predicted O-methyltransferase YrrM